MVTKTKIKKVLALITASTLIILQFSNAYAATKIGTGSVNGDPSFNSDIMWDENFPGTASGKVSNVLIKARVLPTLDMTLSTWAIDLWDLISGISSSWSLFIEIWTNAVTGVSLTVRSWSGWLTNISDNSVQLNDLTTDWVAESYTFASIVNGTDDSSSPTFSATWSTSVEVNDDSTEHTIYTTNKPEDNNSIDDLEFIVTATSSAETPAWYYQDNVTFTVTWN